MTPDEAPARLENPDLVPAWVWFEPPDQFNAVALRGGAFFDQMADYGVRVQRFPGTAEGSGQPRVEYEFAIYRPWTHIVLNVRGGDFASFVDRLPPHCSVIMDCHFPIMDMEAAVGSNEQLIDIIDKKEELLANLALADAVTVSQKQWAADLAEVNQNVFYLPDLQGALTDAWVIKMTEVATSAVAVRQRRLQVRREIDAARQRTVQEYADQEAGAAAMMKQKWPDLPEALVPDLQNLAVQVNGFVYMGARLDAILDTIKALRADPALAARLLSEPLEK